MPRPRCGSSPDGYNTSYQPVAKREGVKNNMHREREREIRRRRKRREKRVKARIKELKNQPKRA